jgi:hypothetical protein
VLVAGRGEAPAVYRHSQFAQAQPGRRLLGRRTAYDDLPCLLCCIESK